VRRGEYRRVEEKRGKVRKWADVPLQYLCTISRDHTQRLTTFALIV
jgi:hypothetical protein